MSEGADRAFGEPFAASVGEGKRASKNIKLLTSKDLGPGW
jgi:hypothetical protein